jgi:DNA invertase Pin-like site-specific DNA recombinase
MSISATAEMAVTLPQILTGREYLRVSQDKRGRQRSVNEQHEANERGTARQGIVISGAPYMDNDVSASRYATKVRENFTRLLADLENGTFAQDLLILWENSRGSRQISEWVRLIELMERRGKRFFITTHGRIYDPANGRDRRTLFEEAVDSEYETYKISTRITRDTAAQASQGRPHGVAPHGYMPVYAERTGELINWVENPEESIVPKTLFQRLRNGDALSAITKDFEAAGYLNRSGKPFSRQHLRTMATRHAYAGLRIHQPCSRGQRVKPKTKPTFTEATWGALVDRDDFWTVQRIISDPARVKSKDGRAKHVLTAALRCGICGGPVNVNRGSGREVYRCLERSCCYVPKEDVDDLLIGTPEKPGAIPRYVSSEAVYEDFKATPQQEARAQELRADLEKLRTEYNEMDTATPESLAEARAIGRGMEALQHKITTLEEEEQSLRLPADLRDLIAPGADVAQRWAAASIAARRQVARLVLTRHALGEVRLLPSPDKRHRPTTERLRIVRAA